MPPPNSKDSVKAFEPTAMRLACDGAQAGSRVSAARAIRKRFGRIALIAAAAAMRAIRPNLFLMALAALTLLPACAPSHASRIAVGSKAFTESLLFGGGISQHNQAHTHLRV